MKIYEFCRAQVSTISRQAHAHTSPHTHRRRKLFVSAAGICICIWCVTTNLQWHLHWQLSVYLAVCLSGCRCLFSLPVYLSPTSPPPLCLSACSCFSCSWAKFALKWNTKQIYKYSRGNLCSLYRLVYSQLHLLSLSLFVSLLLCQLTLVWQQKLIGN